MNFLVCRNENIKRIKAFKNHVKVDITFPYNTQGIVDGSTHKPALVQDTNYMVEKTYHIAPYLGAFGAY